MYSGWAGKHQMLREPFEDTWLLAGSFKTGKKRTYVLCTADLIHDIGELGKYYPINVSIMEGLKYFGWLWAAKARKSQEAVHPSIPHPSAQTSLRSLPQAQDGLRTEEHNSHRIQRNTKNIHNLEPFELTVVYLSMHYKYDLECKLV